MALTCSVLWDSMDCSPPGSSVHGIRQAGGLEWVATFLFQGIFLIQGLNLCLWYLLHCRLILCHWIHQGSPQADLSHVKTCSASLTITERQVRSLVRYHLTPIRKTLIKKVNKEYTVQRAEEKGNPRTLLQGLQLAEGALENSRPNWTSRSHAILTIPLPGLDPEKIIILKWHMNACVQGSVIYNSPGTESGHWKKKK